MAHCPECESVVEIEVDDVEEGQIVTCPEWNLNAGPIVSVGLSLFLSCLPPERAGASRAGFSGAGSFPGAQVRQGRSERPQKSDRSGGRQGRKRLGPGGGPP